MRIRENINDNWLFVHSSDCDPAVMPDSGEFISLPHSWNAVDGHDGRGVTKDTADWSTGDLSNLPSKYDRGTYWYYRTFNGIPQPLDGGRLYVEIPAAALVATVYVNGQKAVYHEGGYSLFRADITDLCDPEGANLLAICVSNVAMSNVYPQFADFTFYGGLYRGVNLVSVARQHFDLDYYGAPGVMVTPVLKSPDMAEITIQSFVKGADENDTVFYLVEDQEGNEVASATTDVCDTEVTLPIVDPLPWSPDDPNLYMVTASILHRNEVVDEVVVQCGIRSFSVSPDHGFVLNGQVTPLRGVCRHQDRLYKGNALSYEDHYEDALLIKEIGANTIRLAHYQQAQEFYDACDELGFVVWAEIPFISIMSEDPRAHDNCVSMMKELIYQSYNHPSICFWGLSNEVLLAGKSSDQLIENHRDLEKLVKSIDKTRLTTIAHVANTPNDSELHTITDVEAWNHYMGWYVGKMEDNGPWLDQYHKDYPDRAIAVSEYGCDAIVTFHSAHPENHDYTEEYQALYHEHMARVFAERPFVWGTFLWNMFDFGAANRDEGGVKGRNNKGLVTLDRKIKKDAFYIYKAWWNPDPMVHICGKRYQKRAGETTEIRVYSNLPSVSLYLNGELCDVKSADKVFVFTVALKDGKNTLVAKAGSVSDATVLEKVEKEPDIYTLPFVRERHALADGWHAAVEGKDLDALLEKKDGVYSVYDTNGTLMENEAATAIMINALAVQMHAEKGALNLKSRRFERLQGVKLADMISDRAILAAVNQELNQIAK